MRRKQKLAILASCMVLCSAGFAPVAGAEEAANNNDDTVLDEVVVTAAAFKQLNPVKFTVVTEEEIKAKGAQNVAEVLKDVTGLYVTTNNNKGKAIAQFRGSDADNTKIFIDGVPLSPVGDGKVDLSAIPADNIAKIEVIKGAVPVIYGTDAPGGVIYITTKKGGDKTVKSLTVTTGSDNDERYYVSVGGKKDKLSYNFGAKHEKTEGYTTHSEQEADYFTGKLSLDINPKSSLTIFGSYSEKEQQLANRIDPATGVIITNIGQSGTITGKNNYWSNTYNWEYDPVKNSYMGALYNYKLNAKSDLNLRVYRTSETSHLKGYTYNPNNISSDELTQDWDGTSQGWELQQVIRTSRANTATWGYAYETRDFTEATSNLVGVTNHSTYDYTGKSFYLQNNTNINSKLSTSIGYRHYENEDHANINTIAYNSPAPQHGTGKAADPVFSFNYALSGTTNLHGSIGKSYRWPNAKERSGPGGIYPYSDTMVQVQNVNGSYSYYYLMPDGSLATGTACDYLLPEEAINRELGVGYTLHGFKFDFTYFNKDITNMIKGQGFGQRHTQYYNIPHVDMQGYEVEVNKKITPQIKGFLNYSYTNAYDTLIGQQVRDIPFRKYSLGVNYTGQDGMSVNLALNHVGSCTSAFSNGNGNGNGDSALRMLVQKLPSYYTMDLKVSKEIKNEEYYFKILNIFDQKYYQGAYLLAPGRYVEVGTTMKF